MAASAFAAPIQPFAKEREQAAYLHLSQCMLVLINHIERQIIRVLAGSWRRRFITPSMGNGPPGLHDCSRNKPTHLVSLLSIRAGKRAALAAAS